MTDGTSGGDYKAKKERSPSFPFISLKKAEERAKALWEKHRREAARLSVVAPTWGYRPKSSGLSQTVSTLKQYGLIEDFGSGEDRKIQLSELGRRLVADMRPGAREAALKEAAMQPRLFQEYAHWVKDAPTEHHRLSDLEIDRGFNKEAAKLFLRAFDETISHAKLGEDDTLSASLEDQDSGPQPMATPEPQPREAEPDFPAMVSGDVMSGPRRLPFAQRLKVEVTLGTLRVSASLMEASEVDTLIKILEANKALLPANDASEKAAGPSSPSPTA
jgi:hypothetical protein